MPVCANQNRFSGAAPLLPGLAFGNQNRTATACCNLLYFVITDKKDKIIILEDQISCTAQPNQSLGVPYVLPSRAPATTHQHHQSISHFFVAGFPIRSYT